MQQSGLRRDYFFEFAGMPQSGKSTVEEIVAHYLKTQEFVFEEYRGGSRYSPLRSSSIADLNLLLASNAVKFVISPSGREKALHKIFLLDRGLIDRYLFTETLLRRGQMDEVTAHATQLFLTSPQLLQNIDGVFVFVTTPERAMLRENAHKLVASAGNAMNEAFLTEMRSVIEDVLPDLRALLPSSHFQLINTDDGDGEVTETARNVVNTILKIVQKTDRLTARR